MRLVFEEDMCVVDVDWCLYFYGWVYYFFINLNVEVLGMFDVV